MRRQNAVTEVNHVITLDELSEDLRDCVIEIVSAVGRTTIPFVLIYSRLVGIRPLLMHKMSPQSQTPSRKKKIYDPLEEAEKSAYRRSDGVLYIPSNNIHALIRDTSLIFRPKDQDTIMRSIFAIAPEQIPLKNPHTSQYLTEYEIHEANVVHNPKAGRVTEWRPMLRDWELEIVVCAFTNLLLNIHEIIYEILKLGGAQIGLGDWRTLIVKSGVVRHTGGTFGKFIVDDYRIVNVNNEEI